MKDGVRNYFKLISRQMNVSKNVTKIIRQQGQYLVFRFQGILSSGHERWRQALW